MDLKPNQVTADALQSNRNETSKDLALMALHQMLMNGGPEERKGVPEQARLYWSYRDEISTAFDVPVNLSFGLECRLSLEKCAWPVVLGSISG